jgi:hypothetical protein
MQEDAEIHQTKCDETMDMKRLTVMNEKCTDVWDMMP